MSDFLTDVETLRSNARANIDKGPITEDYGADLLTFLEQFAN